MTSATSITRCPSVVLGEQDRFNMVSNWIDAIVVCRNRKRHFNVYARKYTEAMGTPASRRWLTLDSTVGLKDPSTLLAAILATVQYFDLELDWDDAIAALARLDWVVAAVVAKAYGCALPATPTIEELARQRASCARMKVEVGVEWGYESHSIRVPMRDWIEIVGGGSYSDEEPYRCEGERFTAVWNINSGGEDSLVVTYDDYACGFTGALADASICGPRVFDNDVASLLLEAAST